MIAGFCRLGGIFLPQQISNPDSKYKNQENSPKKWDFDWLAIFDFLSFDEELT